MRMLSHSIWSIVLYVELLVQYIQHSSQHFDSSCWYIIALSSVPLHNPISCIKHQSEEGDENHESLPPPHTFLSHVFQLCGGKLRNLRIFTRKNQHLFERSIT